MERSLTIFCLITWLQLTFYHRQLLQALLSEGKTVSTGTQSENPPALGMAFDTQVGKQEPSVTACPARDEPAVPREQPGCAPMWRGAGLCPRVGQGGCGAGHSSMPRFTGLHGWVFEGRTCSLWVLGAVSMCRCGGKPSQVPASFLPKGLRRAEPASPYNA